MGQLSPGAQRIGYPSSFEICREEYLIFLPEGSSHAVDITSHSPMRGNSILWSPALIGIQVEAYQNGQIGTNHNIFDPRYPFKSSRLPGQEILLSVLVIL